MGDTPVAAKPATPGASCMFAVGTRAPGVTDDFLDQAKTWVGAIVKAVGTGTASRDLGTAAASAAAIKALSDAAAKDGSLTVAQLDANLGGLRGHTLAMVTHGLDVDPAWTSQEQDDSQGLLLYNKTVGRNSSADIILMNAHLARMKVDGDKVVADVAGFDLTDPDTAAFANAVTAMVAVVDAIRQAVFAQVYLAACGGGHRLDKFSKRLAGLTGKTLYWNDQKIFVPTKPTAPFAEVGVEQPGGGFTVRKGFGYFGARTGAASVDLKSGTDTFLPGSTHREP